MVIQFKKREKNKKAEKYRKEGYIPGVIYGPDIDNILVCIDKKDFLKNLKTQHIRFDFEIDGVKYTGILQEIQKDPITLEPIHFDVYVPSLSKAITTTIPIIIEGEEEIIRKGYFLNKLLNEIEVEGIMGQIPENIKLNVADLELGDVLYVKDIKLPEDIKILTHPETPIVSVTEISSAEEVEEI